MTMYFRVKLAVTMTVGAMEMCEYDVMVMVLSLCEMEMCFYVW